MVEWQNGLLVMCSHSIGMKHLALAVDRASLKAKQAILRHRNERNQQPTRQGQVRSGPVLAFTALSSFLYFSARRGVGCVCSLPLLRTVLAAGYGQVADDSVPDSASSGSLSAAPLTASYKAGSPQASREGRRRHSTESTRTMQVPDCCLLAMRYCIARYSASACLVRSVEPKNPFFRFS